MPNVLGICMHKILATHTISHQGDPRVWEISRNSRGYYRLRAPGGHWVHYDIDWLVYAKEYNMRIVPLRPTMEENE